MALLRRGAFDEAERAFRRVLEGGAAALGDASEAAGDAATAAAEGLDATTACAADVATARRELLRADGTDEDVVFVGPAAGCARVEADDDDEQATRARFYGLLTWRTR